MDILGDGHKFGIRLSYIVQKVPEGLAQALMIGEAGVVWNDPIIGIVWPGVVGTYPGNASAAGYALENGHPLI